MKIFGILAVLMLVLVIGSFVYVANSDVPVVQSTITRDLPSSNLQ